MRLHRVCNHAILLAPSYNLAVDAQAAARCHRGGQTRPCYVYRLLTTGSIDETIIQRQVRKDGLCNMLEKGSLPPLHTPDCALLITLVTSRILTAACVPP